MFNVLKVLDATIKRIWKDNIYDDYVEEFLLKEDSLKNALYYHIRRELTDSFMERQNIRIFTEYELDNNCRADIAIVRLKPEAEKNDRCSIKENIETVLAVIEIKYKDNKTSINPFRSDINKMKKYISSGLYPECQFYLAFICENETIKIDSWIGKEHQWIKNNLTVLDIMYSEKIGYYESRIETYNQY